MHDDGRFDAARDTTVLARAMRGVRADLGVLQSWRLRDTLRRSYDRVPAAGERLRRWGIDPDAVRRVEDLAMVPFTTKDELRSGDPTDHWAVSREAVARVHTSSGSTGRPTVVAHTATDLSVWADLVARQLRAMGIGPGSVVLDAYPLGLSSGGLGFAQGAERAGATVVPAGSIDPDELIRLTAVVSADALLCTPNDAARLVEACEDRGIAPDGLGLRSGVFGGEPWSDPMRRRLGRTLMLEAFDVYGLSEVVGPGVAGECRAHAGLHVSEDHFLAEVIRPGSCRPCEPGEPGELVLTTLTRQAMPLLRYRTGDLVSAIDGPCPCGSPWRRISRVRGRLGDRLDDGATIGSAVLPRDVEEVLLQAPALTAHHRIEVRGGAVHVEAEAAPGASARACRRAASDASGRLAPLLPGATVRVVPPGSLPRACGKGRHLERP